MRVVQTRRSVLRSALVIAAAAISLAGTVGEGAGMPSTATVRVRASGPGYVRATARYGRSVRGIVVASSVLRLRVGTRVVMVATPRASGVFAGWRGACAHRGRGLTCTRVVRRSGSVVADFVTRPPVNSPGGGGSSSPGGGGGATGPGGGGGLGMSIVNIARSQDQDHAAVGDTPTTSECNPYSGYWGDGTTTGCAPGTSSVASGWCADFVAWVWQQAGVSFTYGDADAEINKWTKSFYLWGVANGNWHPIGDGYVPQPGDAVLYGIDPEPSSSGHVGIYVSGPSTAPTVVNGNWAPNYPSDTTSGVYTEPLQSSAGGQGGDLRGYVSP
jgi:hypothetical protein